MPAPRRKRGRRTKCTPALTTKICKAVSKGHTKRRAARMCGIGESTMMRWLNSGRENSTGIYREFWLKVTNAEDKVLSAIEDALTVKAMKGDVSAARFILERRDRGGWGRRIVHEGAVVQRHTGEVLQTHEGSVQVSAQVETVQPMFSDEQLATASEDPKVLAAMMAMVSAKHAEPEETPATPQGGQ